MVTTIRACTHQRAVSAWAVVEVVAKVKEAKEEAAAVRKVERGRRRQDGIGGGNGGHGSSGDGGGGTSEADAVDMGSGVGCGFCAICDYAAEPSRSLVCSRLLHVG